MKSALDEKLDLLSHSPAAFVDRMNGLAEAIIKRDDWAEKRRMKSLGDIISQTMMLADLLGRKRLLMEFDAHARRRQPAHFRTDMWATFAVTPVVPKVPFTEAYESILAREPRLAKSADEVKRAYSGDNGFAIFNLPAKLANDARLKLTVRIQKALADFAARGEDVPSVRKQLSEVGNFSASYAETVFRTNLSTAFTAGRMKQMQDPDVQAVTPAFEFSKIGDGDERPNHAAAGGTIAAVTHPIWDLLSPPLGFNCRHDLRTVDRYELSDRGLLVKGTIVKPYFPPSISKAGPDKGFRVVRTDKRIYGFRALDSDARALRPWMIYAA